MKAITLHQPWASFIAVGLKRVETRDWAAKHRGTLAIHAANRRVHQTDQKLIEQLIWRFEIAEDILRTNNLLHAENYPVGVVIATCNLDDIVATEFAAPSQMERMLGNFLPKRQAWLLSNVQMLNPPIKARGNRSIWNWNQE